MFSASISPPNAAAALAAVKIIQQEPEHLTQLWKNVDKMKKGLDKLGLDTMGSRTPIIPVRIGNELETFEFAKRVFDAGLFVNAVVPPGASVGLVRTSYMATHTKEDLDFTLKVFAKLAAFADVAANQ